jgi:hypothetical protein
MPKTDLLELSATRVELDQRSREARLRLEYVERLLAVRPFPQQSMLRRFLRRLGSRICFATQIEGRSARPMTRRGRERRTSGQPGGGTSGGFSAAPPGGWPNCSRAARVSLSRLDLPPADGGWRWCRRGGSNSVVLSDNKILNLTRFSDPTGGCSPTVP